ncbi:MAG: thrombospondin type 3 repeat-containing protein [Deltaproteobacteria bacterium]|nr:thrombospondin type 3 repeat-containing protein [Deltaproteobacteria bacterium]
MRVREDCAGVANDAQDDDDADGAGDACDVGPSLADPEQGDTNGDGVGDGCDLCPEVADPGQQHGNGDGVGDACGEPDPDGDRGGDAGDRGGDTGDASGGVVAPVADAKRGARLDPESAPAVPSEAHQRAGWS